MARLTDEQLTTNLHISGRTKDGWGSWLPNGEIESMARELLTARKVLEAVRVVIKIADEWRDEVPRSVSEKIDAMDNALAALDAGEKK